MLFLWTSLAISPYNRLFLVCGKGSMLEHMNIEHALSLESLLLEIDRVQANGQRELRDRSHLDSHWLIS